jgi:hypothetical protein
METTAVHFGILSHTLRCTFSRTEISVMPNSVLDHSDPFSAPLTVSNDGYLTIHSVTFRCAIRNVQDESNARLVAYEKGIIPMGFLVPAMPAGEKATVACPFPFKFEASVIGADFDFILEYRPD